MKRWYQSRILWANFGAAVLAAIEAQSGLARELLGVNVYLIGTVLLTGINAILRFDTTKAIEP
jgi:hypothetical protein